jgi:hypothetical protein
MKKMHFYLSIIAVVAILLLLSSCEKSDDEDTTTTPPVYPATVQAWTIKGDTMAWNLANFWTGSENDGVKGAKMQLFIDNPDSRLLWPNNAVLFIGINDLTGAADQDLTHVIVSYAKTFWSIKGDTFCVGIPEIPTGYDHAKIIELNTSIKGICGTKYYVDTWAMAFTSTDGINPDATMNALIKAKVLELKAAL